MRNIITSLVFALLLSSCESDSDSSSFSGTYNSKNFQLENVRLFTSSGEIQDKDIIEDFIYNHSEELFFNYDSIINASFIMNYDSVIDALGAARIEFSANNRANFTINKQSETRTLKSLNDVLYFEEDKVSTVYGDLNNTNSIYNKIYTYKPLYLKSTIVPNGSNFGSYITELKTCNYATGNNLEIKIPILSFKYVNYYETTLLSTEIYSNINNKFNEGSISLLGTNDTLAVQQSYIVLKK